MTFEEAVQTIQPGRYRHFKGNTYEVVGIARHSETEEPMVVYRALYGEGGLWVRPADMWNETVERYEKLKAALDEYLKNEPYVVEGVWQKVEVETMNVVLVNGEKA